MGTHIILTICMANEDDVRHSRSVGSRRRVADPLLREAKQLAAREGTTLRALVEQGLRRVVAEKKPKRGFRLRKATFKGRGLRPELADAGWDRIRDLAYEDRSCIAVDTNILVYAVIGNRASSM